MISLEIDRQMEARTAIDRDIPPIAEALYRLRRRRERLFTAGLFSEPTWDLLLDLFAAEAVGKRVSITSACIAAAVPTTTALRCLKQLEAIGAVYRERDPVDGRRIYVRLSADKVADMESLFSDLVRRTPDVQ
jgi:DNA-binding MarR family transcriptional regulator